MPSGDRIKFKNVPENPIFGSVRWPKALGRPTTTTLAEALRFTHTFIEIVPVPQPDGTMKSQPIQGPGPAIDAWDVEHPDDYLVAFKTSQMRGRITIGVQRAAGVAWTQEGPRDGGLTTRRVYPGAREFDSTEASIKLEDFVISAFPIERGIAVR
jgi:hypothetical protein